MILSKAIISNIEGLVEKGYTVELRVMEGEALALGRGVGLAREMRVTVSKRPDDEHDILFHPTLIDEANPTEVRIIASKVGEDPVELFKHTLPAGFYLAGLKGYKVISQEIPQEESDSHASGE